IQIEDSITAIARGIAKYGDDFEATMYNEEHGVFGLTFLEPKIVWKHEDKNRVLTGWSVGAAKKVDEQPQFQAWDIVHGLRKGRRRNEMYGDSILLPARLVYKILKLMEEQMVIYRLSMHPDRLIFYVDVGAAAPDEARTILDNWRKAMQKKQFFNPKTGQYQEEYNPWALDNNIYWATRPNSESKIEKFQGSSNVGEIFDVEYFRDLIFSAIRVPKAFLGFEGEINAKATLCLDLQVSIPCLDGTTRTLGDIISEYESTGELPWIYSYDEKTKKVVPGRVQWAGITRRDAGVVEVELDDGTKHICTPDHRWFLLDGTEVEAQHLKSGDQLLPLRRAVRKYGGRPYEKVYDPHGGCEWTHRRVAECAYSKELSDLSSPNVHHRDQNKRNNDPRNLEVLEFEGHLAEHRVSRFSHLTKYRKREGAWNKGITKASDDPRAASLRSTTYIKKQFVEDIAQYDRSHISKLKRALLVMHSPIDATVNISEAEKIYAAAKHPKSFISLDKADHLLTDKHDADYAADVIASWAKRYVDFDNSQYSGKLSSGNVLVEEK
ncbi:hypothetical protein LCGC14_2360250, partial [marine sediment metagenome]